MDYDGRFAFVRLRYQGGLPRAIPAWAHDYPRADWHFQRILEDVTSFTRTYRDESNILSLDDPDLPLYPVAYMSEPGFWTLNEAEISRAAHLPAEGRLHHLRRLPRHSTGPTCSAADAPT